MQGGIKYHFFSLWYDSTWNWTPVSRTIGALGCFPLKTLELWMENKGEDFIRISRAQKECPGDVRISVGLLLDYYWTFTNLYFTKNIVLKFTETRFTIFIFFFKLSLKYNKVYLKESPLASTTASRWIRNLLQVFLTVFLFKLVNTGVIFAFSSSLMLRAVLSVFRSITSHV